MTDTRNRSALTPRLLKEGDEEALLALLTTAFGGWPNKDLSVEPIDHLRWKLRWDSSPPPEHTVIELDSQLVGAECTFAHTFRAKDRELRVFESVNSCVHPDYQKRGIYGRVYAFTMENIAPKMDVHLTASTVPAIVRVASRPGRRRPLANAIEVCVRPLTFWPLASGGQRSGNTRRRLLKAGAYLGLFCVDLVRSRPRRPTPSDWSLERTSRFDERFDVFADEASTAFDFIGSRRADYLNWRYADRRAGNFVITLAETPDRILGFSVLSASRGRALVADLLALPGRADVADSLIVDSIRNARAVGAAAIECRLPKHHPYRPLLRRAGFFRTTNAACFFEAVGVPEDAIAFLDNPGASVHLTLGDSDIG
jgi:hypothetical protein